MNFREIGNTLNRGLRQQHRGRLVIVNVLRQYLQIRDGNELVKTVTRTGKGDGRIRVPVDPTAMRSGEIRSPKRH